LSPNPLQKGRLKLHLGAATQKGGGMKAKLGLFSVSMLILMLGVIFVAGQTEAASFPLNYTISGGAASPSTVSFGTITFTTITDPTDDYVRVDVDLVDTTSGDPHKVLGVWLNYNDAKFDSSTQDFYPNIQEGENSLGSPGGYVNAWDLHAPETGNLGFEPQSFLICLAGTDLAVEDFLFTDNRGGGLIAGVHIGNYGGEPGRPGEDSIMVAAAPTPIPGTFLLFGSGLAGLFGLRRRFKK
jgi:hypothetical protein